MSHTGTTTKMNSSVNHSLSTCCVYFRQQVTVGVMVVVRRTFRWVRTSISVFEFTLSVELQSNANLYPYLVRTLDSKLYLTCGTYLVRTLDSKLYLTCSTYLVRTLDSKLYLTCGTYLVRTLDSKLYLTCSTYLVRTLDSKLCLTCST